MTMVLMALEFILANALLEDEMAALSSSGSTWKEPEKRNTWWSKRANAKDAGKRNNGKRLFRLHAVPRLTREGHVPWWPALSFYDYYVLMRILGA
ncbi:hypothetical protein MTO96_021077 [Rhipicephalus appendiculatus]